MSLIVLIGLLNLKSKKQFSVHTIWNKTSFVRFDMPQLINILYYKTEQNIILFNLSI